MPALPQLIFAPDGHRIHRVIGRESDGTTRKQAEEFIEKARRDAREGRLNLPKGRKVTLGFREAARKYLERLQEEGGKDLEMKERRLRVHLTPFFGDTPIAKLSGFSIERYKKHRIDKGAKEGTINRELACISHLFNKALEWRWIDKQPARIKRFKEDQGRLVYLTTEQAERLSEAAKEDQNPQMYPFVLISLGTSMRTSEILRIRPEHVDVARHIVHIPQAKAGTREQPITASLATFLTDYIQMLPEDAEWLFPSQTSASGHSMRIREPFRRVVKRAGLDPSEITPHTLRHTVISHLVQAGVDLPTVQRISGHKTLVMVARYAHQNGAHIQAAMDKLDARYAKKSG